MLVSAEAVCQRGPTSNLCTFKMRPLTRQQLTAMKNDWRLLLGGVELGHKKILCLVSDKSTVVLRLSLTAALFLVKGRFSWFDWRRERG